MSTEWANLAGQGSQSSGAAGPGLQLPAHQGQAITCGRWPLMFRSGWAHAVVDEYSLVSIPRAPIWLRGAINVDGSILPIVDLALYFDPTQGEAYVGRHHRLLIGKKESSSEEMAMALLFKGLPAQMTYTRAQVDFWADLPERLQEVSTQMAQAQDGGSWYEIDTEKLAQAILIHLM